MPSTPIQAAVVLAALLSLDAPAACAQQAMFRGGPAHDGVYRGAGLPAFGGLQWRVQTGGPVRSSPTVAGGAVYVGSGDGFLYAIDARTGDVRWRQQLGAGPVTSTPAVADGLVYVNGRDGVFRALRVADGRAAWSIKAGPPVSLAWGEESGQFYTSSATLTDGAVLFGATDGHVYAADARTGRERWRFAAGARVYSTPAVANGVVYVGTQRGVVHAIDLGTGKARWRYETAGAALESRKFGYDRTTVQSSPAVVDGVVYVGARDGWLYALEAASGTERWRLDHEISWVNTSPAVSDGLVFAGSSDRRFVHAVDAATGKQAWRTEAAALVWSSPVVDAERVYVGDGAGNIYALEKGTGKEAWRYRGGAAVFSSPTLHEGRLYYGSDDGGVYALNAAPSAAQAMRRAVFWDTAYVTAPVVSSNTTVRNYLRNRGYEVLDAAGLQRFMSERLRDRAPSAVVFALDFIPPTVAAAPDDTTLFRRYLDAGGTVVWIGVPPLLAPLDAKGLSDFRWDAGKSLLGVSHREGNFDAVGVSRVTPEGERLGLPEWWLTSWSANAEDVTTVLAYDEHGEAAAWIKRFGGPPGTGYIRIPAGENTPARPAPVVAIQTAAELRPR
jgi:outer membrane protein assembly factor BamB